jgi:hypothetical protein
MSTQATLFTEAELEEASALEFPPETVFLVSCVSQKLPHAAPARYFYTSDWFKKARSFVEAGGWDWRILSAEYGLVHPDDKLKPYDRRVHDMDAKERFEWSDWIARTLHLLERPGVDPSYAVLAGKVYRKWLVPKLTCLGGVTCRVPMQGLGIGEQKAWLKDRAARLRKSNQQTAKTQ